MKKKQTAEKPDGHKKNTKSKPGLNFAERKRLVKLKRQLAGSHKNAEKPTTAQKTITFKKMYRDGICQVTSTFYTKMVEFYDINYDLLEIEDKGEILEEYSRLINYFDPSIKFELFLFNRQVNEQTLIDQFDIPLQGDDFDDIREEYTQMLKKQAAKGNNGIIKSKYLIFGIESRGFKEARAKLASIEADAGCPVTTMVTYSNMENYESVDSFLKECMEGKSGSAVIYEVHNDGGLGRMKFIFDGTDMYVVSAKGIWNADNKPGISYISYTRLKEWKYTDKGWFCYELCVPEPPEVSEIVDGSCVIRIKPMTEEQREMSERLVLGLGYQGQNLLCSNWNTENMSELDYNGMFEYLYGMKYGEKFNSEDYPNGIPKEEFESLIMEYLPITAEQIRQYAVFDEENHTYDWARLGCGNYAPTFFGTSLPEVTDIKENDDGTVTLTVEAVCDMVICDDAVITHELTVRFAEDGSFQYLGNEILNDGIMHIPDYQYRIKE